MYIYGLFSSKNHELRYVGQTVEDIATKLQRHCSPSVLKNQTHKDRWIKSELQEGFNPYIQVIQELHRREDLNTAEIYWIKYFRDVGCRLTNISPGGLGAAIGIPKSEETKRKIAEKQKGKFVSLETRQKMSLAKKGKPAWNKGKPASMEARLNLSKSIGGKPFQDQYGNIYQTQPEAALKINVSQSCIWRILKGQRKTIKGYTFKYLEE